MFSVIDINANHLCEFTTDEVMSMFAVVCIIQCTMSVYCCLERNNLMLNECYFHSHCFESRMQRS